VKQAEEKLSEDSDNIIQLKRKGLDGPVLEGEEWLTPLNPGAEFVVRTTYYSRQIYLNFFRKVCNYRHCVLLVEEINGEEIHRYVIPEEFCKTNVLVEVLLDG
jgi:hypothetical protein